MDPVISAKTAGVRAGALKLVAKQESPGDSHDLRGFFASRKTRKGPAVPLGLKNFGFGSLPLQQKRLG